MENTTLRFTAVGDVTLGDHPVCFGHGIRSTIEKHGFDFLFENVMPELADADILFGNLETVLTTDSGGGARMDSLEFRGKTSYAGDLARIGFNAMSVANNHAMQHGADAYKETVQSLETHGIAPVGISENGDSSCSYYSSGDLKVATIAYSMRPDSYTDAELSYAMGSEERICKQVAGLKQEGCIVILSLHWGEEYLNDPSIEQVCVAHRLIDAGVDLIIGHHPHVLQGIEHYKHGCIVYSLGNFIADFWQEYARKTMIFKCTIDKNGISDISYVPVLINTKFQPELPGKEISERMRREQDDFAGQIPDCNTSGLREFMERYNERAAKAYLKYRKESYLYFIRNLYRYSFSTIAFSGMRFIARRLGFG